MFLWVVLGASQLFILLIGSVDLGRFDLSEFAFRDYIQSYAGKDAKLRRKLQRQLPKVRLLQKLELLLAGVASVTLFTHLLSPVLGAVYAVLSFAVINLLIRLHFIQKVGYTIFEASLELILKAVEILNPLWFVVGTTKAKELKQAASLEEFTDQLRRLPSTVLNPTRRQRLESVLESENKTVKDIMTPKRRVVMIEPSATLGPILLSDLEKSGHGYFPVATKKGQPEGILKLSDIGDIQAAKQRTQVREQMSAHMSWISEDSSLYELATTILQEKQYLIMVRSPDDEFSGLVTIADLMKHLLGVVED